MNKLILFFYLFIGLVNTCLAQGYKIGDKVNDFSLKNIDGNMVSMLNYNDAKGYIVVFTCNHCPFSIAYEDRIIALHNTYANLGYPVIAINSNNPEIAPDDSFDKMIERAKDKKFPFVYLYDETQQVAKKFGATRTPHVFIVKKDKKNKLTLKYIGAIDDNSDDAQAVTNKYAEEALNAIQKGKKPKVNNTKAIGCTIKWKKT